MNDLVYERPVTWPQLIFGGYNPPSSGEGPKPFIVVTGDFGTGKSRFLRRVAEDYLLQGKVVDVLDGDGTFGGIYLPAFDQFRVRVLTSVPSDYQSRADLVVCHGGDPSMLFPAPAYSSIRGMTSQRFLAEVMPRIRAWPSTTLFEWRGSSSVPLWVRHEADAIIRTTMCRDVQDGVEIHYQVEKNREGLLFEGVLRPNRVPDEPPARTIWERLDQG